MNDRGTFDELARRKLDERTFTFEEEHWAQLQRDLKSGRHGRRAGWIWLSAALLLLVAGTALVLMTRDEERSVLAGTKPAMDPRPSQVTSGMGTPSTATDQPAPTVNVEEDNGRVATSGPFDKGIGTAYEEDRSKNASPLERNDPTRQRTVRDAVRPHTGAVVNRPGQKSSEPSPPRTIAQDQGVTSVENSTATDDEEQKGAQDGTRTGQNADRKQVPEPAVTNTAASSTSTSDPLPTGTSGDNSGTAVLSDRTSVPSLKDTTGASTRANDQQGTPSPISGDAEANVPPTSGATTTLPVQKPHAWALEFGILAGPLNTASGFTPAAALDSRSQVTGAWGSTSGGEIMLQWPHFGLGTGLNYTTLAERITSERLATSFTSVNYQFNVQSIDTTLTVVTGTVVQDSIVFYTTTQKDTVLTVLTIDRDTVTTEVQKRAAQETRNTVSYLEIPLLLDAHTQMGRFTFGLRGGPTFGLVQVSQGAVPNSSEDGYTDLRPRTFRETILGYQARLYVRYRLTTKLSVGVEPLIRGTLQDVFGNDLPSSRPTAWGGALSLTWRF